MKTIKDGGKEADKRLTRNTQKLKEKRL